MHEVLDDASVKNVERRRFVVPLVVTEHIDQLGRRRMHARAKSNDRRINDEPHRASGDEFLVTRAQPDYSNERLAHL